MNRFLDGPAPRGRVASRAPRYAPLERTPLPNRLRHVGVRDPRPRLHTTRNAPRLKNCRTPPGPSPQSQPMFVAGRRGRDFVDPSLVRTRTQSRAEIGSSRARVPLYGRYTAGCIWPDANFLLRQCCARVRSSRSGAVSCLLTAMDGSHSNTLCPDSQQGISAQRPDVAHGHSTGTVHQVSPRFGHAACAPVPTTGQSAQRPPKQRRT